MTGTLTATGGFMPARDEGVGAARPRGVEREGVLSGEGAVVGRIVAERPDAGGTDPRPPAEGEIRLPGTRLGVEGHGVGDRDAGGVRAAPLSRASLPSGDRRRGGPADERGGGRRIAVVVELAAEDAPAQLVQGDRQHVV